MTCPPLQSDGNNLHVSVNIAQKQVHATDGSDREFNLYTLGFGPPIVLYNMLPFEVLVKVYDLAGGSEEAA